MTTILMTGGDASDIIRAAAKRLDQGDRVVLFHEFPNNSVALAPTGAEIVFDVDPDGLTAKDIAEIYGARQVVDFDETGGFTARRYLC